MLTKKNLKEFYHNIWLTLSIIIIATLISYLFHLATKNSVNITIIYILAILLIARFTSGYLFGVIASLVSILCVNYLFTYPYFAFNFTLVGYIPRLTHPFNKYHWCK